MSSRPESSKKRAAEETDSDADMGTLATKITKLHPLFTKQSSQTQTFKWLPPLGSSRSCLHGINLDPKSSSKVAAFDLDGCIIKSSFGKGSKKNVNAAEWEWWRSVVPSKLREVHQQGFSIVVVSNQALKDPRLDQWKKKIPLIGAALPDVPFRLLAASKKDGYRKPMPGMYDELERIFGEENVKIDKSTSFFVGDAAGRPTDFAATDRKWSINIGLPFFTPEEYFLKLPQVPYVLSGFHPSSVDTTVPPVTPTSTPIIPSQISTSNPKPDLVLFVGYPALGKSTFYRKHFKPAGYAHINQDTFGTREKCIKAAREALKKGESCVVDNTNRDRATRKFYVDLAKECGASIRCFHFDGSYELAWHNNLYRAFAIPPSAAAREPKRELVPAMAFLSYRKSYQEPTVDEGFIEIKHVNFIFEGNNEERRRWEMWLQIEGK